MHDLFYQYPRIESPLRLNITFYDTGKILKPIIFFKHDENIQNLFKIQGTHPLPNPYRTMALPFLWEAVA